MGHIIVILYICCFNAAIVALSGRKFGQCLPVSLMSMPMIMFVVQFATGSFRPAYGIMVAVAIAGILLAIVRRASFCKNYCTVGLTAFLTVCGIILILDYRHFFSVYDEFYHWGTMVKEMVRLDTWYSVPESRLLFHKEYPPFVTSFATMWCSLAGGFSEMGTYYAEHIFMYSLIVPVILENIGDYIANRNAGAGKIAAIGRTIAIAAVCQAFLMFLCNAMFNYLAYTIYEDLIISLEFAYVLMLIAHKDAIHDRLGYIALLLGCASMLMTKEVGICFAPLAIFYYLLSYVTEHGKTEGPRKAFTHVIPRLIPLVVLPTGIYAVWKHYTNGLGIVGQFDFGQISLQNIAAILSDNYCETFGRKVLNSYIHSLFERDLANAVMPITYAVGLLLVLALIWLALQFRSSQFDRKDAVALSVTYILGTLGYAFALGISYLFCFSEYEMSVLASYERYMATYVFAEIIAIASVIICIVVPRYKVRLGTVAATFALAVVVIGASNLSILIPKILDGEPNRDLQAIARQLDEQVGTDGTVFILAARGYETQAYINYYADTIVCTPEPDRERTLEADLSDPETVSAITDSIFNSGYLYVKDVNDAFNESFRQYNNGEDYIAGTLYRIDRADGAISLTVVNE